MRLGRKPGVVFRQEDRASPSPLDEYVIPLHHHTRQAFSGYIGEPFLQPKAFPNSSKFCTVPFTRNLPGECGSTFTIMREYSGRRLSHQICPKPIKKRCAGVKPSTFGPSRFLPCAASVFSSARNAMRMPPLSAVFSPSVSLPFTFAPGSGANWSYSLPSQFVLSVKALRSAGVCHSRRLPLPSYFEP